MKTISDVMQAIQTGNNEALQHALAENPQLSSARDENGNSPLLMATYYGRKDMVQTILDRGAQPNFFEACAAGLTTSVEHMLTAEPSLPAQRSHDGWTPLHLAAFFGHLDVARMLIDAGADMMTPSQNRESNYPINAAAAGRHTEIVRLLLERGCPADARVSSASYTAFHVAATQGNLEMATCLLRAGADPSLTIGSGETAMDLASKQGHADALRTLLP